MLMLNKVTSSQPAHLGITGFIALIRHHVLRQPIATAVPIFHLAVFKLSRCKAVRSEMAVDQSYEPSYAISIGLNQWHSFSPDSQRIMSSSHASRVRGWPHR